MEDLNERYPHGPGKYHSDCFQLRNLPTLSAIIYCYNLWPTSKADWAGGYFAGILDRIANQLEELKKDPSQDPRFQLKEWV